jgi:hydrogenase maturation protease
MSGRVLVIAFGNPLVGDDGAGPAVARELAANAAAAGVRIEDGGTDVLPLPSWWRGEPEVWIIDAVRAGGEPGTVHRLDHETILSLPQTTASLHHLSIPECLRWILHAFPEMRAVRFRLWGIEPAVVSTRSGLSEPVAEAVGQVASELWSALSASSAREGSSPADDSDSSDRFS